LIVTDSKKELKQAKQSFDLFANALQSIAKEVDMNVMLPLSLPLSLCLLDKAIELTLNPFDNLGLQLDDASHSVHLCCIVGRVVVSIPSCRSIRDTTPLTDVYLSAGQNLKIVKSTLTRKTPVWVSTFENAVICLSHTPSATRTSMLGTMREWIQMKTALQLRLRRPLSLRPPNFG
jgi:hypothetical protein